MSSTSSLEKSEKGRYTMLNVFNRYAFYMLMAGSAFYFINSSISWKYDTQSAIRLFNDVSGVFKGRIGIDLRKNEIDTLDNTLATLLEKEKLQPVYLSNFIRPSGVFYRIVGPTITARDILGLEGISSRSRKTIDTLALNQLKESYFNLNLSQFVVQGAFFSEFQLTVLNYLLILAGILIITNSVYYYHLAITRKAEYEKHHRELMNAKEGSQASPLWVLAQETLNRYYERNLLQNNWIFIVSVVVMTAGFGLILYGIGVSYAGVGNTVTYVSAASGIIVQFIGATFLFVYKSTVEQAMQYTTSLQKASTIGTSIKILETIKSEDTDEMRKDKDFVTTLRNAKIDLAKLLMDQAKL